LINGSIVLRSQARVKYERRTKTLIESFKARQIGRRECIAELDAAFARFVAPNRASDDVPSAVPTVGEREWPSAGHAAPRVVDAQYELSAVRAMLLDNKNAVIQKIATRSIHLMP
jgi:hypothetical protein